jgi:2-polyprenyl-3-methyl-5-hydroxy-6-metoxy-1,4-benzoquinol methylase
MMTEGVTGGGCNVCGASVTRHWAVVGGTALVQCCDCGLVYTFPRPSSADLHATYQGAYVEQHQAEELVRRRRIMYQREAAEMARRAPHGRFLDVGCATGEFLATVADRYEVYGVDVSAPYVEQAQARLGADRVQLGQLSDTGFAAGSFDVVQFRGVLQHVEDPAREVQAALRLLRPGGLLVISATPNIDSWCARLFRDRFRLLSPTLMLYNFAPRSLRRLLERSGLQVEAFSFPYWRTPYFHWSQPLIFAGLVPLLLVERVIPSLHLPVTSPPFWGNMMTCYARRPFTEN